MKIIRNILNFIDKIIVVPITKLIVKITGKHDKSGKKFEALLTKPTVLLFISLFLSITLFVLVDQKRLKFFDSSAQVFKNQTVEAIYNEEAYVVEGLPETVDITLIGSKADLYIANQSSEHTVTVDLTGLEPGTHKVNIEYNQGLNGLEYSVNPSVATVIIYDKVSDTRSLDYDILNEDKLDKKFVIEDVNLDTDEVTIRGAEHKLDEVTSVKALIDVEDLTTTEVGTQTIDNVTLKAYDKDGNVVDVEFVPEKVKAEVTIASPSKEVSLNFVPKGKMPFGKAISSYSFSQNKITIYGPADVLKKIDSINVEVDVTSISSDTNLDVTLKKPSGVKSLSDNSTKLDLKVTDIASDPAIFTVSLTGINVSDGLVAQPVDEDNGTIEVEATGAKSVLDSISSEDITAYVNLKDYKEGTYDVKVEVKGKNPLASYISKKTKAKVKLSKSK